jgi:hypothetical protein
VSLAGAEGTRQGPAPKRSGFRTKRKIKRKSSGLCALLISITQQTESNDGEITRREGVCCVKSSIFVCHPRVSLGLSGPVAKGHPPPSILHRSKREVAHAYPARKHS